MPSNEPQDELLIRSFGRHRQAFVIATAATRQDPDRAVATATDWFASLGLTVEELPLRTREARCPPIWPGPHLEAASSTSAAATPGW